MKKTLALILCIALALAIMPTALAAGDVASVGNTSYATLESAYTAAASGATIKMLADVSLANNITIKKKVTLDLNSKTISYTTLPGKDMPDRGVFLIKQNGNLTVIDSAGGGIIAGTSETPTSYNNTFTISEGGKLTIEDGTFTSDFAAAYIIGNKTPGGDAINSSIIVNGGTMTDASATAPLLYGLVAQGNGASVVVNGGSITADQNAISGNGIVNSEKDNGGTIITINGGILTADDVGPGIYIPQDGTVTITGGTISGYSSGIGIKCGSLNISGGTIIATGPDAIPGLYGNGILASGAALQVESNDGYKGDPMKINITGGNFLSYSGVKSIYEYAASTNTNNHITEFNISGGNYVGEIVVDGSIINGSNSDVGVTIAQTNTVTYYESIADVPVDKQTEVIANSEPSYIIVIPELVDFGTLNKSMPEQTKPFFVKIENALLEDGASVKVDVGAANDLLQMYLGGNTASDIILDYGLFNVETDGTELAANATYVTFGQNTAADDTEIGEDFEENLPGRVTTLPSDLTRAGAYKGTMVFDCTYTAPVIP